MPASKSKPQLPRNFIDSINAEYKYRKVCLPLLPVFHDTRMRILGSLKSPDEFMSSFEINTEDPLPDCTYLHHAACFGDIILTCEMIRMGARIDTPNGEGVTALYGALSKLEIYTKHLAKKPSAGLEATCRRVAKVAMILIEHHADVNLVLDGWTLLNFACMVPHWEIIEMLLQYGADPFPPSFGIPPIANLDDAGAQRFMHLVRKYAQKPLVKPLLPCPCFSGLPLVECHAKTDKPYPGHHVCICSSEKRFEHCCEPRRLGVYEEWDDASQRIKIHMASSPSCDPAEEDRDHPLYSAKKEITKKFRFKDAQCGTVDMLRYLNCWSKESPVDGSQEWRIQMITVLYKFSFLWIDTDPAFKYAMGRAEFIPWPTGKQRSKIFCQARQTTWNALVDD
ncbi:hypothetical protein FIBSPDRAFT_1039210 [Athelia psychrophila]|uniref:Uncharacterized protein n=1 Tax=Athelia psychrophila TaxID=1759441 RepID=A0A166RZY6_9AGAM|nr:hypothetical protein FIBSPDRAFT_1039207 [Fibularhizoctonia sp. CBS 109695]KZP28843.1 hypothetical protein FIBSPDRAFT_1039210 [Fibularhizoctonia sp. CBS 109695]